MWLLRQRGRMVDVERVPELQQGNGRWRIAVWGLRVGFVGLAVAVTGLVAESLGSAPWILAVGEIVWLAAAVVTLTAFFLSRHELSEPRPGYWPMRFLLIHDTFHARPSAKRA
jgi:O-antigen/teichoic acid export membrane protein